MKNFRSAGIFFFFAYLFLTMSTRAAGSWQVKFYCAPGSGNKMPPTTYVKTSSRKEFALVTWESAPQRMTNQQRCNKASQRFQTAWDKGSLDRLVAGKDKEGLGIICGLSYREDKCDRSNTLFTLSRYSDAQDIIDKLKSNIISQGNSSPIFQGSGRNSVDFKQLIQKAAE
jgi:hypothetical protein